MRAIGQLPLVVEILLAEKAGRVTKPYLEFVGPLLPGAEWQLQDVGAFRADRAYLLTGLPSCKVCPADFVGTQQADTLEKLGGRDPLEQRVLFDALLPRLDGARLRAKPIVTQVVAVRRVGSRDQLEY